jgi:hypothetical protein
VNANGYTPSAAGRTYPGSSSSSSNGSRKQRNWVDSSSDEDDPRGSQPKVNNITPSNGAGSVDGAWAASPDMSAYGQYQDVHCSSTRADDDGITWHQLKRGE